MVVDDEDYDDDDKADDYDVTKYIMPQNMLSILA